MGKVHGSLARAGKVKAATKKEAKVEKKRPKFGRAYKRYIYNVRYAHKSKKTNFLREKLNSQVLQNKRKELKEQQKSRIALKKAERGGK
mmetsp:Transcript_11891/g.17676  ORF Transcript_11891/g.17676 Transcript_11891/m.17676 type:complete len:89 (+) Transcript_11891:57-323(+)